MGRANWLTLTALAASLAAGGALAIEQDIEPIPEAEAEAAAQAAESTLLGLPADVAFGIAMTTDYVSRGITQNDSSLGVQGYIEPTIGMAYLNIWSSNVDFGGEGFRGAEIDTAIGIRPEFGPLSSSVSGSSSMRYVLTVPTRNGVGIAKRWMPAPAARASASASSVTSG